MHCRFWVKNLVAVRQFAAPVRLSILVRIACHHGKGYLSMDVAKESEVADTKGSTATLCTCINQPLSLSNLISAGEYNQVMRTAHKHWQDDNKENEAVLPDSLPSAKKSQMYAEWRLNKEKLQDILQKINDANWSRSDFLYYTF